MSFQILLRLIGYKHSFNNDCISTRSLTGSVVSHRSIAPGFKPGMGSIQLTILKKGIVIEKF